MAKNENLYFITGGIRSGKSEFAERLSLFLSKGIKPLYIATAKSSYLDKEFLERIDIHKKRRAESFLTYELEKPNDLIDLIKALEGVKLIDSLGAWIGFNLDEELNLDGLVEAVSSSSDPVVIVSEEVGLAPVATTASGRRFQDLLGELNKRLASFAKNKYLIVAGGYVVINEIDELF